MKNRLACSCGALLCLLSCASFAQTPPASDPQAVTLAAQAISALTGGTAISDITLNASATWTPGSTPETGTAVAYAKGFSESRIDLTLSEGNRSDIRNSVSGYPQGAWIGSDGASNSYAAFNCWTDPAWFYPALSSIAAELTDPTVVLAYVGPDTRNGASVEHIQSYRYISDPDPATTAFDQQMSTVDYYLDASSSLPMAVTFNTHPDNNPSANIPVEVDFANYQAVSGFKVPYRIQEMWQGNLILDLTVTNAALNTGLLDSLFQIP
jgi:opacity protein-like surface antigen